MLKKILLPFVCLSAFFSQAAIDNPALNPVEIKEPRQHAALNLIQDGKASLLIVADMRPEGKLLGSQRSVSKSVQALQEAFQRCAGIQVPVCLPEEVSSQSYDFLIALGDTPQAAALGLDPRKLPKEGFAVCSYDRGIVITGNDGSLFPDCYEKGDWYRFRINGTLYGTYDFIERFLGVRYYFPGIGTIFPPIRNLTLEPLYYLDAPYFENRMTHAVAVATAKKTHWPEFGAYEAADWEGRYRMALSTRYWAGHGPNPQSLADAYPDKLDTIFYRDQAGYLYYNTKQHIGNYFDVSNLKFVDILMDSIKRYYESEGKDNTGWKGIPGPNRDWIYFGQCDTLVRNMDTPSIRENNLISQEKRGERNNELSDVYARFHIHLAEEIARQYPGKRLSLMPYHNYVLPPQRPEYRKCPDNIDLRVCVSDFPRYNCNPEKVAYWKNFLKEWSDVLGGRPVASLWLYNEPLNLFGRAIVGRYIADIPKQMGAYLGRLELYFDLWGGHDWEYFYTHYLVWRSMWNPNFNQDAALNEMWQLLFGAAAKPVAEFYQLLCERWENVMCKDGDRKIAYNSTVLDRMEALLQQAASAVPTDSLEARRLSVFNKPWAQAIKEARGILAFSKPNYKVVKVIPDQEPVIDGRIQEPVWQTAREMRFEDVKGAGEAPKQPVMARLLWDAQALYGCFQFSGKSARNPEQSIWNNDSLEVFLSPALSQSEYFQYVISSTNETFIGQRTLLPVATPYSKDFPAPKFRSAVQADETGWTLEWSISWADLKTDPPADYDSWFGNFIVNRLGDIREVVSYSMTLGNNHNVEQFGFLKFLGAGDR